VLRADRWWAEVERLAPRIPADAEEMLHHSVVASVDTLTRHYLAAPPFDLDRRVADDQHVATELDAGAGGADRGRSDEVEALVAAGVERQLAEAFDRLRSMATAGDIGILTRALGASVAEVVAGLRAVDAGLGLSSFGAQLAALPAVSRWERWQARRLRDDVARLRRAAVLAALSQADATGPGAAVAAWLAARKRWSARFERLAGQVRESGTDGHSVAALAVRALAELVDAADNHS
jgi:NAD-specific glutamate dehydrogenase